MASLVSQMRNGQQPYPQTPQHQQQQSLNDSIERTRAMMQQVKNAQNPQAMLAQMLQSNPNTAAIANMLKGGSSLENTARQMAAASGIDIEQLIKQLGGM